jgi:hypothetical protein
MSYSTERGVTSYADRDTPAEFATGQDEDAAAFNGARDRAFAFSEEIATALDAIYGEPIPSKRGEMAEIADGLAVIAARVAKLST